VGNNFIFLSMDIISEEQLKAALEVIEAYKLQVQRPVKDGTKRCFHHGSWLTNSGASFCPACELMYNSIRCKVCDGTGRFDVPVNKPKTTKEEKK
jgi:hypothetical protein